MALAVADERSKDCLLYTSAQSMRDKGVQYKLNWGASLLHLREMAAEYEKDYDLAIALWKRCV